MRTRGVGRRSARAFELLTPIELDVLQQINAALLRGTGDVSLRAPGSDGSGGQIGSWLLTWPELSESSSRFTGKRLQPVTISAVFPAGFTHPHLAAGGPVDPRAVSLAAWPMQATSREDAEEQRPVFWAIATARGGVASPWRPVNSNPASEGACWTSRRLRRPDHCLGPAV